MIFSNGMVFMEDGHFHNRTIITQDSVIDSLLTFSPPSPDYDLNGCLVIPGLIDTHFHGCYGADFSDGTIQALTTICQYELSQGITSLVPATMTLPLPALEQCMRTLCAYHAHPSNTLCADIVGAYLEGPFLSREKAGAQSPEYLRLPDISLFEHLQILSGNNICTVALAPELHGIDDFLSYLQRTLVTGSIAHTSSDASTVQAAFAHGIRRVTHLYNAMECPEIILNTAAHYPDCMVELICDGIHVSSDRVRHVFDVLGPDRVILISDSMRATGFGDGISSLGGQEVNVHGRYATLSNGRKAGSVVTLYDCFLTALSMDIPLEWAVKAVTHNPAKNLNSTKDIGYIRPGAVADFLVLTPDYSIQTIVKNGRFITSSAL